jgi:UDP-N-acetylmuramate dehydrogenase
MQIQENISLQLYNSFGIASAQYFARFQSETELAELVDCRQASRLLVLGGGSNILLTNNFDGLVIKNEFPGIEKISEDNEHVYVKTGAGENWHRFVMHCVDRGWAGVENLSLIPGNTGASPMQNIGAYGVEIKDVFHELEAFDISAKKIVRFALNDCQFGYRDSIFKQSARGAFVIVSVTFRLNKTPHFNIEYGALRQELEKAKVQDLSIRAISDAVIRIRSSKLPDPAKIGNAGSFFKNPEVTKEDFQILKDKYPAIPGYPQGHGQTKLAAGWLIEQCGWKGYRRGDAGCHSQQALVLVNYGHASGNEIFDLSTDILQSVKEKFGVELEREVNIIG